MISEEREKKRALASMKGGIHRGMFGSVVVPGDVVISMNYKRCGLIVVTDITPEVFSGVLIREVFSGVLIRITRVGHVRRSMVRMSVQRYSGILLVNESLQSELPRIQEVIDEIRQGI